MNGDKLETLKAWASIASAIAMPIVVAIVGYFVQKQLANEGLRKDYVQIAISVLTQPPTKENADLRQWAVRVLESNSPVPFSDKARENLFKVPFGAYGEAGDPNLKQFAQCMSLRRELADKKQETITREQAEAAVGCFVLEGGWWGPKVLAQPSGLRIAP